MHFFFPFNLVFFLIFSIIPSIAWSYTNFISYGYTSCTACHYNPYGGGPLTDYGRALYATTVAGKLFPASEAALTDSSGFFFTANEKTLPDFIRPSIDYRSLYWTSNFQERNEEKVDLMMNLEGNVVLQFNPKVYFSSSWSVYPDDENTNIERDKFISRENYLSYILNDDYRVQAGLFDTVFGLRIPDHTALSKNVTGLKQNDQTLGASVHLKTGKIEGGGHLFLGSPHEEDFNRQKGLSFMGEFRVLDFVTLGGSGLYSSSDFLQKTAMAIHTRAGFSKGSSLIVETGYVKYTPQSNKSDETNTYVFTQGLIRMFRGMHFLSTFEFNTQDSESNQGTTYKYGPGLLWFPMQRLEIRTELFNSRAVNSTSVNKDNWNWFTNLHISL